MTAKEFFEKNKGKYFDYQGHKVRVVGMSSTSSPILVSGHMYGWDISHKNSKLINFIDNSLVKNNDKLWFASIDLLKQEEFNLCEILEGCEGVELWSDIFGRCKLESSDGGCNYEIEVLVLDTISGDNGYEQFTKYGKLYYCYPNGKCMLWPSETNRDWSTFVKPIRVKEGTPVMTKWNSAAFWKLENYTKDNKSYFIVPVSDFDFTDFDSNKSKSIV